jgi:hypothetical protein
MAMTGLLTKLKSQDLEEEEVLDSPVASSILSCLRSLMEGKKLFVVDILFYN